MSRSREIPVPSDQSHPSSSTSTTAGGGAPASPVPADSRGEDRFRAIFEAFPLPVVIYDPATFQVVDANEAAVAQYGYTRDEFVGLSVLAMRPAAGAAEFRRILTEMPTAPWRGAGIRHVRKDGTELHVDVWSHGLVLGDRRLRVSALTDVSERVQLEAELRQAQKMEAVGRLAGGVAHDFNNVLTAIVGGTEFLAERFADDAEATVELDAIARAAERATSLTRHLLAFSRQQVMQSESASLNDVAERAAGFLRGSLGEDIEIDLRLAPDLGLARIDTAQLDQVVLNLAVNARDAMPRGGRLTIATRNVALGEPSPIDGITVPAGAYVELVVQDTGEGMDELTRAAAFEPFFTTKGARRGSGLGLSMVYGIVRQSEGFVSVDSAPGAGATFRILLPRAEAPAPAGPPAARAPAADGQQTVLVVEDEPGVRRITCRVLTRLGFAVLEAEDGQEALRLAQEHPGDLSLVVTDVIMPRMSGRELAAALVAAHPGLRVLYVSGYTDEAIGRHALLQEGVGFLQKPFSMESLGAAVQAVLQQTVRP
ncbi:MAG TPA: response regulator [Gemmatimonadaceae bacterium]|nr:response regulator [Gemmatimonadaceae bacterium]